MSKYVIDSSTLTSIADAVRTKGGTTEPIVVSDIPTAITNIPSGGDPVITELTVTQNGTYTASDGVDGYSPITVNVPQDGSPPESAFVISGDCQYRFAKNGWNWFIEKYGDRITTKDISNSNYMFHESGNLTKVPFDITFNTSNNYSYSKYMFEGCKNLLQAPIIYNLKVNSIVRMFANCHNLRTIPENFADTWDWSYLESQTGQYEGEFNNVFYYCYSLRSFPMNIFKSGNPYADYGYNHFNYGFYCCYVLDELINLPIPYTKATWTSNAFNNTFDNCYRLKNITFSKQNNDAPIVFNWKSQVINLTNNIGYVYSYYKSNILNYNSGITADKEVTDDATYQALKNDPDWFTAKVEYSRYNHDSAVNTINSLPDTSAYLATAGGTNTIKFKGQAGEKTDGGAINTLTEEEIAVAAAKGWTVSLV